MRLISTHAKNEAFTLLELIVVLCIFAVVMSLMMTAIPRSRRASAPRIKCTSNLKQVALSFRMFAGDNDDHFPFFATNSLAFSNTTSAWMHFECMSNELASPKILVCPADSARIANQAVDFSATNSGFANPGKQNNALSYFVAINADETRPNMILAGDRNIARSEKVSAYSSQKSGAINVEATSSWSRFPGNAIHDNAGNFAMADGSVQQATMDRLQEQLKTSVDTYGTNANLFLFPQ